MGISRWRRATLTVTVLLLVVAAPGVGGVAAAAAVDAPEPPVWVVNSAADPGVGTCDATECTLREAFTKVGGNGWSEDIIQFDIPGPLPITIRPVEALPYIYSTVVIDGFTQPGYSGVPVIEVDGSLAGDCCSGIRFGGDDVYCPTCEDHVVRGLVINRWANAGILDASSEWPLIIENSYIGTDVTGTIDLGNGGDGVAAPGGKFGNEGVEIHGSVISGNGGLALSMGDTANRLIIKGSRIGTDITGREAMGNDEGGVDGYVGSPVVVGGPSAADANVISANGGNGIRFVGGNEVTIQGNRIGTDITGTEPMGNAGFGIYVFGSGQGFRIGGSEPGTGNVIAANKRAGIGGEVGGSDYARSAGWVRGNWIGTDPTGQLALGNGDGGIFVVGDEYLEIGGRGSAANVIANNLGPGIRIRRKDYPPHAPSHDIRVFDNEVRGNAGLAVDIGDPGPTPNDPGDADEGDNRLQNFPVVQTASSDDDSTHVTGTLDSMPGSHKLDVYAAPACGRSGRGESTEWLGSVVVTITAGPVDFDVTLPRPTPAGWVVTATATNGRDSSEYSPCRVVA